MNTKLNFQHPTPRSFRLRLLTLAALGPLALVTAQAQDSYWTFGLGGGQTRGVFDDRALSNRNIGTLPAGGFTNYSIATDRRDAGYKVFLGRQFNTYLGMELGYVNLGKYGFSNTTTPAGRLNGEIRAQGVNVDLLATMPLTTNLSALGRVGATYLRTRSEYSGSGAVATRRSNPSSRGGNAKFGLGLQYAFNDGFQMRGEAEEYRVHDAAGDRGKVRMYSVSLVFPFGRSAAPAPRMSYAAPAPAPMPAPVVVAQAPPPPPVVVMPAPAPAPRVVPLRRVSYSAESIFGFDQSQVQPAGQTALNTFAAELAGTRFDSISVEGHTDRIGSNAYNQALSLRRAEAVKAYLVNNARIDAAKISAVGRGEDKPVTNAQDCKGNAPTAKLIACLQPDRRVDIEVSGTR